MSLQNTIGASIHLVGVECYGGNYVETIIKPAQEDTGVIFQTKKGDIRAKLDYASQSRSSILLNNGRVQILNVEHILATLYAYEIDNALIEVRRIPSRSFRFLSELGLATDVEVVPIFEDREKTLCDKLDEAGVEQQHKERVTLKIDKPVYTERLSFEPIDTGLILVATTNYPIPGEQTVSIQLTPQSYRDELSRSRPYAKHAPLWLPKKLASAIAAVMFPSFGIWHGFDNSKVFLPVKNEDEWYKSQRYASGDEITRHTIVDRLGALALLEGRLEGVRVLAKYSGHANDLRVLREQRPNLLLH
ncbi:UDP-3-O-acyl-N-acetylglucosamine deacetylase [Candidatus Woesearchaeota archaeon]|nr:UDP-3-O-acyl-N-acetylglucosamine deacetylase [Candidatus Woesearchaeota archaeon]